MDSSAPGAGQLLPAAVFDWDDTLHSGTTLIAWIDFLVRHAMVSESDARGVHVLFDRAASGRLPYEQFADEVTLLYASSLIGSPSHDIVLLAEQFVNRDERNVMDFVRPMLSLLHARRVVTLVISGCPQEILDVYRQRLNLVEVYGTVLSKSKSGETLSGGVQRNPALAVWKEKLVAQLAARYLFTLAIGNTDSGLPLLRRARHALLLAPGRDAGAAAPGAARRVSESDVLPLVRQLITEGL